MEKPGKSQGHDEHNSKDPKRIPKSVLAKAGASTIMKIVLVLMLIVFLLSVYYMNDAEDVPMQKIEKALIEKTDIDDLKHCNSRELLEYIGIDYASYESVLYYKSREALDVKEILIVKAKDKNDLPDVQDAVDKRVASQITTYRDYAPDKVAELNNAMVTKRGKYLFYCVAKDPETYEGVFLHVI